MDTAYQLGWQTLANGELLSVAEEAGYEIFLTTDQNLKYQQNLMNRKIAVVVLTSTSWPRIRQQADTIITTIESAAAGSYNEILIP